MFENNLEELKWAIQGKNVGQVRYIVNQMEDHEITKDVLLMAVNSRSDQITRVIAGRANAYNFDKEVISEAINTRVEGIVRAIENKTDSRYIDKDIIKQAIETRRDNIVDDITKNANEKFFDKEVMKLAFDTNRISIIQSVARKTHPKHFDKELIKDAINTRNDGVVKAFVMKADEQHFDKDLLKFAMNTHRIGTIQIIAHKTESIYFDKEIIKQAIDTKQDKVVRSIVGKADESYFDKEILKYAMGTKRREVIENVAYKTDEKYFDKEILKEAINSKNDDTINAITKRTDKIHFDKDILKASIDTRDNAIVYDIASSTDEKHFTKEVLEYALNTKDANVVRPIVDYTSDRALFSEYKDAIHKSILSSKDIQGFAGQILSRSDNESFDREMQETVLDIYMDVITNHFKKGDIPNNFPMKAFEDSINESRYFLNRPSAINFDSLNNENKFLLIPITTQGHAYSAVVRKLEEDRVSVTFVNLGYSPHEVGGKDSQYKEYVYTEKNALKVLKDHTCNLRVEYPQKAISTDRAYKNFGKYALEEYLVNVTSRHQKVGNCFLKNIEKGLRYAVALGLSKSEDRSFDARTLRVITGNEETYKVKFLKPLHRPGEKTNDLTTVELRQELIKSLIKKFPDYQNEIMHEWNIYKQRKERTVEPRPIPEPKPRPNPAPIPEPNPRPNPAPNPEPSPSPRPRPRPYPGPNPRPFPYPNPDWSEGRKIASAGVQRFSTERSVTKKVNISGKDRDFLNEMHIFENKKLLQQPKKNERLMTRQ